MKEALAYNIRVSRAKMNISQETLAEMAEISTKHVTDIETMKVSPSIFVVYKLANALGLSVNDLVYK